MNFQKPKVPPPKPADSDRMPTHAELLHELRKHGAKPPPRAVQTGMSRRTRDFLLLASIGSGVIAGACFRMIDDPGAAMKLAATDVGVFCGLTGFIFYGVMNRY